MRIIGRNRDYVIGVHVVDGAVAKVEHRALAFLTGRRVADVVAWAAKWGITVELSSDDERADLARAGDPQTASPGSPSAN
jgi:hypothetical protein